MRYVAIGDSFTEGVGDEQGEDGPRGWADLVAAGLAAHHQTEVWYANLAIRGRLLEPIITEQLEAALALDPAPTILTLNGGGNDMMRPGADLGRLTTLTARAVDRCLRAGVTPVLLAGPDPSGRLPFGRTLHRRAAALTDTAADIARARGVLFVNVFADDEIREPRYWSQDRLHLNSLGHLRVASLVLTALGVQPPSPSPSPADAAPWRSGPFAEASYYWRHVRPWVTRRLTGRSSGDGRDAKHRTWALVEPALT
ncbi:SGNH/GDSL hydrolase family protein [Frankia sp. CNm7]|uniref:SGNH/GDSL hydrolase family protein n=1 Tax=Frankia nepalensis TaxID=1836974 RepID=A0A937RGP4_9ACTN|nr:SGNH/GDSL hydrolase family protein [Frankia nepalensis]MBL7495477.1 SGNH/GDSL hydrolase family protein [Frankia nepalensis]MBL7510182.1 SGNH/GDSL hydrolase family protein [Frankia nepalensis]MBL7518560.1 SGNH/GDSL hydrolase family protein [Frankia nepalensis]MBL7626033.1 SGNH/GDSL hydrolase family protein [Frankia nepalensis]